MGSYNPHKNEQTRDEDEHANPFLDSYLDEADVESDRYLINFVKGVMTQERNVKADMIKVLKEQILVLRQELFHKQSVIDALLRHYDRPCNHGNKSSNHGSMALNPFSNAVNLSNHPMRFDEDTSKPVFTIYSTSSPIPSPFPSSIGNHCSHGNKMQNTSLGSCLSNDSMSSLVSKTADKCQAVHVPCTSSKTKDVNCNDGTNCVNDNSSSEITVDVTNKRYRNSPSRSLSFNDKSDEATTKNEFVKPLSETLLSLRNSIRSNTPQPERSSSVEVRRSLSPCRANSTKDEVKGTPKDTVTTQKTVRVKFNKNGAQTNVKKND